MLKLDQEVFIQEKVSQQPGYRMKHMMELELDKKIVCFVELLRGRLADDLLNDVVHYIKSDERGLAFETLCDHLSEYEIVITKNEYDVAISICNELGFDVNNISIKHMFTLIG